MANRFYDFTVGEVIKHRRGKTITEHENVFTTLMTLNTAEAHFNKSMFEERDDALFTDRVVMGLVTVSLVCGLSTQDLAENAIRELGIKKARLKSPVYHGDTLYATSQVLSIRSEENQGIIVFFTKGYKSSGVLVAEVTREILYQL